MPRKNARPAAKKEAARKKAQAANPKPKRPVMLTHGSPGSGGLALAMLAATTLRHKE